MNDKFTQFDYLLNAMTEAGRHDKPADHGYGEKRRALYAYVRDLEARASLCAPHAEPVATIHRGGLQQWGKAQTLVRWEDGANALADGEHKLYAAPVSPPTMLSDDKISEITMANAMRDDASPKTLARDLERAILSASAAPTQPDDKHEREMLQVIDERDNYHGWCDSLADAIAKHLGIDIGEHSSANNPWGVALIALEEIQDHAASAAQPGVMQQLVAPVLTDQQISAAINGSWRYEDKPFPVCRAVEAALLAHLSAVPAGVDVPHGGQQ